MNTLSELQKLIQTKKSPIRIGSVVSRNPNGPGYYVQRTSGAYDLVRGSMNIGDTVAYRDGVKLYSTTEEITATYYIK